MSISGMQLARHCGRLLVQLFSPFSVSKDMVFDSSGLWALKCFPFAALLSSMILTWSKKEKLLVMSQKKCKGPSVDGTNLWPWLARQCPLKKATYYLIDFTWSNGKWVYNDAGEMFDLIAHMIRMVLWTFTSSLASCVNIKSLIQPL